MHNELKWNKRYLDMAKLVSSWSKDPSTQCGAVIVNADNEIEPYTYIETESGLSMCVAMPVLKFHNFLHELEDKEAEL